MFARSSESFFPPSLDELKTGRPKRLDEEAFQQCAYLSVPQVDARLLGAVWSIVALESFAPFLKIGHVLSAALGSWVGALLRAVHPAAHQFQGTPLPLHIAGNSTDSPTLALLLPVNSQMREWWKSE